VKFSLLQPHQPMWDRKQLLHEELAVPQALEATWSRERQPHPPQRRHREATERRVQVQEECGAFTQTTRQESRCKYAAMRSRALVIIRIHYFARKKVTVKRGESWWQVKSLAFATSIHIVHKLICPSILCSGPVPVLVMSLLFIASVFMLHIWGKFTKA
jgi:hypothetical protein